MKTLLFALCAASFLGVMYSSSAAQVHSDWREQSRRVLGGNGGWDLLAVDAPSRRVFLTRGDHVQVADVDSGKIVGDIPGLNRSHGVALVPALGRGYVTSGGDNRVAAFDLKTLATFASIPAGENPDAIVFDSVSSHVFAFNGHGNSATVIDPKTNKTMATIPLPGKPELAVSDAHGKVFVNLEDKGKIAAIDSKTNAVVGTWSLGTCEEPSGLAIDAVHVRLFSVCSNKKMAVLDASNGNVIATLPIGERPDGAAFDPDSANAFSSNSDGTMTIVHEDDPAHFRVLANVVTPAHARTIALDEKTHRVVLPYAQFGASPAPTTGNPHPRPPMKPDSFGFVVIGRH